MVTFGERLTFSMQNKGYNQSQLASKILEKFGIRIPVNTISRWCHQEKSGRISRKRLEILGDLLEVSWVWLAYGPEAYFLSVRHVGIDRRLTFSKASEFLLNSNGIEYWLFCHTNLTIEFFNKNSLNFTKSLVDIDFLLKSFTGGKARINQSVFLNDLYQLRENQIPAPSGREFEINSILLTGIYVKYDKYFSIFQYKTSI